VVLKPNRLWLINAETLNHRKTEQKNNAIKRSYLQILVYRALTAFASNATFRWQIKNSYRSSMKAAKFGDSSSTTRVLINKNRY
jgi:hypothetical protein